MTEQIIVGEWDPSKIISLERDTGYEQELNRYLDFLKTFDPNKPWWTTRDNSPVNVVDPNQILYTQFNIGLGVEVELRMNYLLLLSLRFMVKEQIKTEICTSNSLQEMEIIVLE